MLKRYKYLIFFVSIILGFSGQVLAQGGKPAKPLSFSAGMSDGKLRGELDRAKSKEDAIEKAIVAGVDPARVVATVIALDPKNAQTYKARAVQYSPKSEKDRIVAAADNSFAQASAKKKARAEGGIAHFKDRDSEWDQWQLQAHTRNLNSILNTISNYTDWWWWTHFCRNCLAGGDIG